jgi:molybdate transport system substrate-binding protein
LENRKLLINIFNLLLIVSVSFLFCSAAFGQSDGNLNSTTTANIVEKPLRIAVASNFAPTLKNLLVRFNKNEEHFPQPLIIAASSGTLFLQIKHGAAFDLFLSADAQRPQLLTDTYYALEHSQQTYAYGQLALWSANPTIDIFSNGLFSTLKNNQQRLAIANPKSAPYGKAAQQALENLQLWQSYQHRLIQGINIGQTFQQTRSQAVNLGIVSNSQLVLNNLSGVLIPLYLYQPIKQQLVILKRSEQSDQAQRFVEFLLSKQSQQFIADSGYATMTETGKYR